MEQKNINNKKICVIVPAFNEEKLIKKTIESIPNYVQSILVINDCSVDETKQIVEEISIKNKKISLVNLEKNMGVGFALRTGYLKAYHENYDIGVVMPGDAQALAEDFYNIVEPVCFGKADYSKGNRLKYKGVSNIMPKHRFFGNSMLTLFTKFATGYYHIMDPQMGYTALNLKLVPFLNLDKLIKRYGYPGQLLYFLNLIDSKVSDVNVKPHYGEEKSGIKLITFIPKLFFLLIKLFFSRVFKKIILGNLSPAGITYFFSFLMFFIFIPIFLMRALDNYFSKSYIPELTFIALTTSITLFFIFFFFGVLFDVQENKDLIGDI